MRVTVGHTPQKVTGEGWGNTVVYNEGPSTVYLGEDTSGLPDVGIALPPLANTVWQDTYPLYVSVKSDDRPSVLSLNRAGGAINDARTKVETPLYRQGGNPVVATPLTLDTSSYESLSFSWNRTGFGGDGYYEVNITWGGRTVGDAFTARRTDKFQVPYFARPGQMIDAQQGATLNCRVRGERAVITLTAYGSISAQAHDLIVSGSTRTLAGEVEMRPSVRNGYAPIARSETFRSIGVFVGDNSYTVHGFESRTYDFMTYSGTLTLTMSGAGGIIASDYTPAVVVHATESGGIVGFMDVPVVTTPFVYSKTFEVPVGTRLSISPWRAHFASNDVMNLNFLWS